MGDKYQKLKLQKLVLGSGTVNQPVNCLIKAFAGIKTIIRLYIKDAIGLVSMAFKGIGQITALEIDALFRLGKLRTVVIHRTHIFLSVIHLQVCMNIFWEIQWDISAKKKND
jgi:hypothetical protein